MRGRLTYANVVATIALFIALGGASYAAIKLPKNSVGTKQLKKNAVTGAKLKNEAITAAKVKKGALTGNQINASSLGTVPSAVHATSAEHATNADRAMSAEQSTKASNGAVRIDFLSPGTDQPPSGAGEPAVHQIFNADGMTLRASCIYIGPGEVRLYATIESSVEATFQYTASRFNNPGFVTRSSGGGVGPGGYNHEITDVTGGNRFETGELVYRSATNTISVLFRAGTESLDGGCEFLGTAFSTG